MRVVYQPGQRSTTCARIKFDSAHRLHYRPGMRGGLALSGIRALDLCDQSGTYCGRLLAEMGADVILVEPPGGSPMRAIGPFHPDASVEQRAEASLFFWHFNANKRSIRLDLDTLNGRQKFLQLAA